MNTLSKSLERIGFAATAVLTLAPLFFQGWWPLIAAKTGAEGDAYWLTWASLAVAVGAIVGYLIAPKPTWFTSVMGASLVAVATAVALGGNGRSLVIIALALLWLALFVSWLLTWLMAHLPTDLDGRAKAYKITTALFIVSALLAVTQTARLSIFMGDEQQAQFSTFPSIPFLVNHACLTAYVQALKMARAGEENLYDALHWPDETKITEARSTGLATSGDYVPFFLDTYMYPPQFLLLPAVVLGMSDNFMVQRALWFGFCGLWLAAGFWITAMWVGEKGKRHPLLLIPFLWGSLVILTTLQIGNAHHVVMVMAILGMIAFERQKPVLGGALLAFAVVAKISPLFLAIILLVQRRWRDAAWTIAFGLLFTLLTLVVFGLDPIKSFLLYELPRLSSGEAMRWFTSLNTNIIINTGPFSIPYKLSLLGVHFKDTWAVARVVNSLYTLSLLGLVVAVALQKKTRVQSLCFWLGVLTLSGLQSPFSPSYVLMPVVWLLTVLTMEVTNLKSGIPLVMAFLILSFPLPSNEITAVTITLIQQAVVLAVILYALWYKPAAGAPELALA